MPTIDVNGTTLAYDDEGSGPTIAFSHGLLWSRRMYGAQIAALRDRYRCVSWDHRGQGESAVPPERTIDIETVTEDAIALIEALDLAPVHFVGLSMGGFVGMRIAARRPELVRSLVLLETAADPEPEANKGKYTPLNWIARMGGLRLVAGRVMPIMFGPTFLNSGSPEVERWRQELLRNKRTIYRAVNGVIERQSAEHELQHIRCPTVVIRGDEDAAIALERSRALADGIDGARFVRLPVGGHSSTVEVPDLVNAELEAFLDGLPD